MKKDLLMAALFFLFANALFAQAPQKFNYQGVARSTSGSPLASTTIGLRLTIHNGSSTGTVVYQETQSPTTNGFGLYTVAIGAGTVVSGTFSAIAWGSGDKYLQVEIDPAGGSSYTSAGTSQLLSVPYAMYAASSPASGVTSVTAGAGLSGGTITGSGTISMPTVGTAGTFGSATQVPVFTTDAYGRVTGVTNTPITTGGIGTVTTINTTPGQLTGGPITTSGTLGLATAGTAGTYGSATQVPVITTDAYGRVTGVTNTPITAGGTGTVTTINTTPGQLTGGPITTTGTLGLATAGTAGTYGSATQVPVITTDAYGRVTSVTNTPVSAGTVTSVTAGTGLSGGTITTSGTISLPNVGTAGTYGSATQVPVITTDAQGRVSSVTNTGISVPTVSGTTNYVAKFTGPTAIGNSQLFDNGTTVGIGTATPSASDKLESINSSTSTYTSAIHGISGSSASTGVSTNTGVLGESGTGIGVTGVSSGAHGMYGISSAAAYAGTFGANTGGGYGVWGAVTGTGAAGYFDGGSGGGFGVIVPNGRSGFGTATPTNMGKMEIYGVGTYSVAPVYQAGLVVDGPTTLSASGVYAEGGWKGVYGHNLGTLAGVEAIGVHGKTEGSAYTGTGYGVKGENTGTGGTANYGVFGVASGATGTGVGGSISGGGTAVSGVITSGTGIAGKFDGGTGGGYGVIVPNGISGFGTTVPSNMCKVHVSGVGTYSVAPYYQAGIVADGGSGFGNATGVYGEAGWRGLYGRNTGGSGGTDAIGVHGRQETGSSYTNGYGVKAEAFGTGPTNYGVFGNATSATVNNYGVYGTNTGTGYAGYFAGNVRITGSITKGSGTFLIDHPLDPEHKYLYHSFVESPDMMNIYNGNITTDASGEATVTMPGYFDALNKDFRYQLTVIGTFAQAIVLQEMSGNTFKIKTDKPDVKVSWQVTGVRQDKYANAHRVVPEVEKEPMFQGHYLHAAEWGQPYDKSFDAITTPSSPENNIATKH